MWKWNHIICLIFLVPRGQALVKYDSPPHPDLVAQSFEQIDELLGKLALNHRALQDIYQSCPESPLQSNGTNVQIDSALLQKAQAKFKEIRRRTRNQDFSSDCPNVAKGRGPPISARSDPCKSFKQKTIDQNGKLVSVPMLNCTYKGQKNVIVPMPSDNDGSAATKNSCNQPTCTPFEQNIKLPKGKSQKVKLLNCVYPDKTSFIVPISNESTGNPSSPPPGKPNPGNKSGGEKQNQNVHIENTLNVGLNISNHS